MLIQLADSVAQSAHAASQHGGMKHSMGPYSVAAAAFPYLAVGFLYIKRAILRRRYHLLARVIPVLLMLIVARPISLRAQAGPPSESPEEQPPRFSFDAQARVRTERWNHFGFGSDPDRDDVFVLGRVMLGTDVRLGSHFRSYVQARSSFLSERNLPGGNRPIDEDHLDLQNAFLDVSFPIPREVELVFRGGRQELLFGRQRLVSPLDWANTRRTFDGARAILDGQDWSVHAFFVRPVKVEVSDFNWGDEASDFFGVYVQRAHSRSLQYDLYWLVLDRESAAFNGTAGDELRHTLGARLGGQSESGWDYDLEVAYQAGDVSDADISAFMVGSELGWTFRDAGWTPRIFGEFDYGSGDDEPGGEVNTFNQLFPLGHAYLGYIDALGRQNVAAITAGVRVAPHSRLMVTLKGHGFWRASDEDGMYDASGAVLRPAESGTSKGLGSEIDALASYKVVPGLTALVGYSRFEAGPFIEESGQSEDPDLLYVSFEWRSRE